MNAIAVAEVDLSVYCEEYNLNKKLSILAENVDEIIEVILSGEALDAKDLSNEEMNALIAQLEQAKENFSDREKIKITQIQGDIYIELYEGCVQEGSNEKEQYARAENECSEFAKKAKEIYNENLNFAKKVLSIDNKNDVIYLEALQAAYDKMFHGESPIMISMYDLVGVKGAITYGLRSLENRKYHNDTNLRAKFKIEIAQNIAQMFFNLYESCKNDNPNYQNFFNGVISDCSEYAEEAEKIVNSDVIEFAKKAFDQAHDAEYLENRINNAENFLWAIHQRKISNNTFLGIR